MGLPAVDMRHRGAPVRPRLRVVSAPKTRGRSRSRSVSSARYEQRCREVFTLACVIMVGVTLFGLGRVMVSARATETAFESGRIESDIKAERLKGDLLEIDKSALAAPSRIEGIAGQTLKMAAAPAVDYMTLPSESATKAADTRTVASASTHAESPERVASADVSSGSSSGLAGMLASVMRMAAGEAEVLLVGDAGLASAR